MFSNDTAFYYYYFVYRRVTVYYTFTQVFVEMVFTVKTVDFCNDCKTDATSVILGKCQAALHSDAGYFHDTNLRPQGSFSNQYRLSVQGLEVVT